jgi:RND family efflux transporter MFP subunit
MKVQLSIAAFCLVSAAACNRATPEEVESETVVPVTVVPAQTGNIRAVIHATGTVTPAPGAVLLVVAPEPARIAEIPKGEGDRVARGDLLVRFEIPSAAAEVPKQRAEVTRAQAQVENARAAQTRARELFDRGVAARKEVEDADRDLADAQAALAQAQAALAAAETAASRAVVRAPFAGVIAKRMHNPGDLVEATAGDPVLRLIDPQRLEVTASVPIGDVARVVVGARAHLTGGARALLTVVSRPAAVEEGTAAVPIRLAFAASSAAFPAAVPVQIHIDAEEHTGVVLVPAAAVVHEGQDAFVYVAVENKAERRPVMIGISDDEHAEVRSGVKAGEMVITRGQAGLPDGATIAIEGPENNEKKDGK